ncbi:MAG: agglutinin biogenesis protein MshP [Betaproteobacteria bacterium]|nr:agglutinin biogenesis protein MshP [Betaproteobacteria bacterium]
MTRRAQRGLSTVTALFLVTVLVGVGVAGAALLRAGQDAATLDLQALRAAEAARAGLEWASWRITRPVAPICAATTNLANLPGTLAPYVVTVSCQGNGPYNEGGPFPVNTYALRAVACNQPLPAAASARCPNPLPTDGYIEQEGRGRAER